MTRTEAVLESLGLTAVQKRGGRAWMLCVFHEDHAPTNFFVRLSGDRAGQSHCFACGGGGSIYTLVERVRGCTREQARAFVQTLGRNYEPPRRAMRIREPLPTLGRRGFRMPPEVIFEPLASWVSLAREEAEHRGLTQDEVDLFEIGYAVDGARLAGRIVLPWLGTGRVLAGYSARTFCGAEPRYQTPSDYENADRSVMFGEHLWPSLDRENRRPVVVVTEGAFNALAVRRVCPDVAVAALGGSTVDPMQVLKLATFRRVVLVTDPDIAGEKAAKALGSMLGRNAELGRVRLPEGKDADDILRERGVEDLRSRLGRELAP